MPKEFRDKLNGILDWWKIGDFTDRKGIHRDGVTQRTILSFLKIVYGMMEIWWRIEPC